MAVNKASTNDNLPVTVLKGKYKSKLPNVITNIKDANGNNNATFNQGDTLIAINQTLIVGEDLKPGKYTLLTSDQSDKVNVRIGRYVKEYAHGQEIILSDNTKITPVSGDIILR